MARWLGWPTRPYIISLYAWLSSGGKITFFGEYVNFRGLYQVNLSSVVRVLAYISARNAQLTRYEHRFCLWCRACSLKAVAV